VLEVGEKLSLNFSMSMVESMESKIYKSNPMKKKSIRWQSKSWETYLSSEEDGDDKNLAPTMTGSAASVMQSPAGERG
jgi:hypothetical protein